MLTAQEVLPRRPELLARGPAPLMHFLLDVMVDHWLPIMDQINDEVDGLEESLFDAPDATLHRRILRLKRGMSALRRIVGPQRDTVLALTRDEFAPIPAEIRPYLRDVYDRLARVSDLLDSFRDETASLLELHASQVSNQLNVVIKRLTVIATIGLPADHRDQLLRHERGAGPDLPRVPLGPRAPDRGGVGAGAGADGGGRGGT